MIFRHCISPNVEVSKVLHTNALGISPLYSRWDFLERTAYTNHPVWKCGYLLGNLIEPSFQVTTLHRLNPKKMVRALKKIFVIRDVRVMVLEDSDTSKDLQALDPIRKFY